MIEGLTHLAPGINVCSNIGSQAVTLPADEAFRRLGKQAEPLRRHADGPRDLPKTTDVANLPTTRQDLRDIRAVNPKPVRKLRMRQALLLHELRQDNASVRTVPRPGLSRCLASKASPALVDGAPIPSASSSASTILALTLQEAARATRRFLTEAAQRDSHCSPGWRLRSKH